MNVEIGRMSGAATPASCMPDYVMEHVIALMTLTGIESISAVKYSAGFGSKLHVSIGQFAKAPEEVAIQGVVIKDAIAQIMSIANIARIVIKPGEEDVKDMEKAWEESVRAAKASNAGSSQSFAASSDGGAGSSSPLEVEVM